VSLWGGGWWWRVMVERGVSQHFLRMLGEGGREGREKERESKLTLLYYYMVLLSNNSGWSRRVLA